MNHTVQAYAPDSAEVLETTRHKATSLVSKIVYRFRFVRAVADTRKELDALSDGVLRDIGICRNEIHSFARKHAEMVLSR